MAIAMKIARSDYMFTPLLFSHESFLGRNVLDLYEQKSVRVFGIFSIAIKSPPTGICWSLLPVLFYRKLGWRAFERRFVKRS